MTVDAPRVKNSRFWKVDFFPKLTLYFLAFKSFCSSLSSKKNDGNFINLLEPKNTDNWGKSHLPEPGYLSREVHLASFT